MAGIVEMQSIFMCSFLKNWVCQQHLVHVSMSFLLLLSLEQKELLSQRKLLKRFAG